MNVELYEGDCLEVLATLPDASVDAVVTDPPGGISFMNREWDRYKRAEFVEFMTAVMAECLRVLKPGGHALVWAIPRTSHWTATAIEDAGFEVKDVVTHHFSQGFPKSLDVSKAIDKAGGQQYGWFGAWLREERQRRGIHQKELARHFPSKTGGMTGCVANWELGLNLPTVEQFNKLCEVLDLPFDRREQVKREIIGHSDRGAGNGSVVGLGSPPAMASEYDITAPATDEAKRWQGWGTALKPASEHWILCRKPLAESNVASQVLATGTGAINVDGCRVGTNDRGEATGKRSAASTSLQGGADGSLNVSVSETHPSGRWPANLVLSCCGEEPHVEGCPVAELGNEARYFYTAKASIGDRTNGLVNDRNLHPTVKSTELMRWLVKLITPPGGTVLDCFAGSGSTLVAAKLEGFNAIGIEREPEYVEIARRRLDWAVHEPTLFELEDGG